MNICVFASGTGTNFASLINASKTGYLNSNISLLITNNPNCKAAETAKKNSIPVFSMNNKLFPDLNESQYFRKIIEVLEKHEVNFIVLAGYMKKIPNEVINRFRERIINIHPALLPLFGGKDMYGINVHKAVIASGMKVSGITIHFVDENYDEGKIIFQKCCEVSYDDDEFSLQEKVKLLEHEYYPKIIKKFEEGKVNIVSGKVNII